MFTSQSIDLGFLFQVESYQKALKNDIHSFPAWCSANKDSVENKPAGLLVVSLGKWDASIFMWQTGGGAKQSTCHGGPV